MAILWFSASITVNNMAVDLLAPSVLYLGFSDSAMMVAFGSLLGSTATAYMSIWMRKVGIVQSYAMASLPIIFPLF